MLSCASRRLANTVITRNARPQSLRLALRGFATRFAESHEWIKADGDTATIGISDHAQKELGDIVYIDLPSSGASFEKGERFGSIESVKAASDVYVPVSGEIIEANTALSDKPDTINSAAETDGWIAKLKIKDKSQLDQLMDEAAYKKFLESN